MGDTEEIRDWRRAHAAEVLADFVALVALENVTGDVPALRRNAEEIVARLRARGAEVEAVGPDGVAPLVVGRVPGPPGAPRLGRPRASVGGSCGATAFPNRSAAGRGARRPRRRPAADGPAQQRS